jgi:nucleoside-diphosphate-sugar epimerase
MDWKNKKVLVSGVTGFIGSNLIKELLNKGSKIIGIDNYSYIDYEKAKKKLDFFDKIEIIEGDVTKKETWSQVPKDVEFIFHFAAPSSITLFKRDPEKCLNETLFGLKNALDFAKENKVKKVIYPSTGSLYAGAEMPHNEDIYPKPRNIYAAAKVGCEGIANSYADFVDSIGLRIFAGYGPGEEWKKDFGSVLFLFIKDYMNDKAPEVWGDGFQTRDFIYIEDIVKAILKSAEVDYTGRINIGTGRGISFKELLNIIKENLGKEINPVFLPKEKNYVENIKADTELMEKILKIKPQTPEQGIEKYIKYLKETEFN